MSICGTCGKSIGDGIVYGAKYSNKAFCSPWCASAYDDKHLMYQRQKDSCKTNVEMRKDWLMEEKNEN